MKLRFIYKYKGNKVEHDKFLHCKNQMSNQNLHAIKKTKREYKHIEDMYITSRLVVLTPRYLGNCQQIRPNLILGNFFATRKYFGYWLLNYTLYIWFIIIYYFSMLFHHWRFPNIWKSRCLWRKKFVFGANYIFVNISENNTNLYVWYFYFMTGM